MPLVDYAIFDDIAGGMEKGFHMMKQWFGCQNEIMVKKMYRGAKLCKWGKPSIWLCNDDPLVYMKYEDACWLKDNAYFVNVTTPIFRSDKSRKRTIDDVDDVEEQRIARGGSPDMSDSEALFVSQDDEVIVTPKKRGASAITAMISGYENKAPKENKFKGRQEEQIGIDEFGKLEIGTSGLRAVGFVARHDDVVDGV